MSKETKNNEVNENQALPIGGVVKSLKSEKKMNFGNWKFSLGLRYTSDHTYKDAKNE